MTGCDVIFGMSWRDVMWNDIAGHGVWYDIVSRVAWRFMPCGMSFGMP